MREPPFSFQKPTDAEQVAPPDRTFDHPCPMLIKSYPYPFRPVGARLGSSAKA